MRSIHRISLAFVLAIGLSAFAIAKPANAQIPGFSVGLGFGPSLASGDFGGVVDTGWHVQGLAELSIPLTPIGVRANLDYHRHSGAAGLNHNMITGGVNGKVGLPIIPMILSPYLTAGVSMYNTRFSQEVSLPGVEAEYFSRTRTDYGVNAGGGIEANLLLATVFVEARWHNLFGDGPSSDIMPLTFGVKF
jgi:hypothetical protein